MKLLFFSLLLVWLSKAERLDNIYLPPSGAYSAGGDNNFLVAPPLATRTFPIQPSTHYLPAIQTSYKSYTATAPQIPILKSISDNNGRGSYRYEYETGNGIAAHEVGDLKNGDTPVVHGSYSYIGPDGRQYTVTYTADENGFHPHGEHLPILPEDVQPISFRYYNADEAHQRYQYDDGAYHYTAPTTSNRYYVPPSTISRQYLTPRKPNFSPVSGYHY